MSKTVLFLIIQFSMNTQFSSVWLIDRTISGVTILGQSGPGSNGNEGVLCISQNSSITGTSPSDCLVSYPGHSFWGLTTLQRCSQCILQHPNRLDNFANVSHCIKTFDKAWYCLWYDIQGLLVPKPPPPMGRWTHPLVLIVIEAGTKREGERECVLTLSHIL